ncbi:MAG: hypothetical protein WCP36_01400 [Methanomicrobiales archaeon]
MRPFITFIGLILMIPGYSLLTVDPSDLVSPRFSTPSGTIFWNIVGNPRDIGIIHQYGLAIIILAITIVIIGLLATPGESEKAASQMQ